MRAIFNTILLGGLLGYALTELGLAFMLWGNRCDEQGRKMFGFAHLAVHFLSDAVFLLLVVAAVSALGRPSTPAYRWWLLTALTVRALGSWPLAFKFAMIPKPKIKLEHPE